MMIQKDDDSIQNFRIGWFFLIWFIAFSGQIQGQQLFFKQFAVAEGLAQSTIFKIIQDRNDIYWVGTQAGVSSFDGTIFTNYSSRDGLALRGVRAICEDRSGVIWVGHTGGGVSRYNGEKFEEVVGLDSLIGSTVTSMVEDSHGHIWITTETSGMIELINPLAPIDSLIVSRYGGSEISDRIFNVYLAPSGSLYFITDLNVKIYNRDSLTFDNVILNGITQYHTTTSMLVDSRGKSWFGKHNGGLFCYDPESDQSIMYDFIEAGLSSNFVSTIFEDSGGKIWIGTWDGGVVSIAPDDEMTFYTAENGLPGMKIWSIMEDREGNILIGTQENGLCIYIGDQFVSYFEEDGLINPQVLAIMQVKDGTMWFGTNEGISILMPTADGEKFQTFKELAGVNIAFLKEDKDGTIWIGSFNRGVYSYSKDGIFTTETRLNSNIVNEDVTAMSLDSDNDLWVGTMDGLIKYEIDKRIGSRFSQSDGLQGNNISAVFADSKGRIWVGSSGVGISVIEGDSVIPLDLGPNIAPRCFTEDLDGNIWIGTEAKGVMLINPVTRSVIRSLTMKEGLLANLVNLLSCDRFNNIYIGTNKGLNTYQRENEMLYSYTASSGFVGIETKHNASIVDRDGNLWFGTVKGATSMVPSQRGHSFTKPQVHITELLVNHEFFPLISEMRFSPKQNSFIFEYRCITLNPDAVLYQIMLEGVDAEWRDPDTQTSVNYPALRHGKYTFLVKARNSKGVWNDEPVSYRFEIMPPFYLTWYFILAGVVALGLMIIMYIKIRERALKRENIILEKKVKNRTAIVVAQKEELAQKNKDITDSIRYAKRIQFAILPEKPPFKNTFILFKPKDIVSGDFYWFLDTGERQFFSAVDCTGHGVPGAFMSIIGHNSLNKIVREYGIMDPGKILSQLNKEVISTLHQRSDTSDVMDGMDLSLICYIPGENILEYAGAFSPLYLVRNGEIIETKADKVSIGRSSYHNKVEYTTHRITLQPKDTVYLFSDGYADQFGGEKMKKFKYRNFKNLLLKIQGQSMDRQRLTLDQTIEEWRGDIEQLDDILIVGRRF